MTDMANENKISFALSFISGFVDTAGFIALFGLFTAHITGNLVLAATALFDTGTHANLFGKLLMVPVFMTTVLLAGYSIRYKKATASNLLLAEAVCILCFALAGNYALHNRLSPSNIAVTAVASFAVIAMALQNTCMRKLMNGYPANTVMTGNITEFTIDLFYTVNDYLSQKKNTDLAGLKTTVVSLRKATIALTGFLGGCLLGALLVTSAGLICCLLPAFALVYVHRQLSINTKIITYTIMAKTAPEEKITIPIGIAATGLREESDSMGTIAVPANHYWGAQTQRSLLHFSIGNDRMPAALYHAYGYVKKAAALVNEAGGRLQHNIAESIVTAADEVIEKKLDTEFPLYVWQTGSGTQSNMNVNEVIANRAIQLIGGDLGSKKPVHPNDHVNMCQSSNDSFPTAMHIAAVYELDDHLIPAVEKLQELIAAKANAWKDVVKIGRTHLEDAVPLTVGQEWSGYSAMLKDGIERIRHCRGELYLLAAGGTAVGTGLNAPADFGEKIAAELAKLTGKPFVTAPNKFAALGSLDAMVAAMAAIRNMAVALMKIANDMRWLASGPRSGLGELILPANEPGSSIMPGKVNPTQCEAIVMICIQVIGEDNAVAFAGSQGNFELNAMRPIIINNFLHSARILADGCDKFRVYSVEGTQLNQERIDYNLQRSLMLVTALSPVIGYDKASSIAHNALEANQTLREAALASGFIDGKRFDEIVDPKKMV